jgi:hypothetical protein
MTAVDHDPVDEAGFVFGPDTELVGACGQRREHSREDRTSFNPTFQDRHMTSGPLTTLASDLYLGSDHLGGRDHDGCPDVAADFQDH